MSNDRILISIIIPYYNVDKKYFDKCFESLRNQSFREFEAIIIDDGSEPEYSDYLDEIASQDQRFLIRHQKNRGVSEARNAGLSIASGEAVCFVDADDYIAPWMLEDLWQIYQNNSVDAVAACYNIVYGDNFHFNRNKPQIEIQSNVYMKDITLIGMNCNPESCGYLSAGPVAVLFKTAIARRIEYPRGIKYMEDVIWNTLYYDMCKQVAIYKECVYAYRQNCSSATHKYQLSVIEERKKSLSILKECIEDGNQWFPLRLLSSYTVCCRCIMKTDEIKSFKNRISQIKKLNQDPIWDDFKARGIPKDWSNKFKLILFFAKIGLLPYVLAIYDRLFARSAV